MAERTLDDEVRHLEEELAGFNLEKVRESTLERRLEMFEQLRSRAALFAGVLAFKADGLNERIASMRDQLRRHLAIDLIPVEQATLSDSMRKVSVALRAPFASDVGF